MKVVDCKEASEVGDIVAVREREAEGGFGFGWLTPTGNKSHFLPLTFLSTGKAEPIGSTN